MYCCESRCECVDFECEVCTAVSRGVSVLTVSVRCVLLCGVLAMAGAGETREL